ncbi:MAG: YdcF family protein [Candidatus Peribacteria bacterium]|nr:YdcF family protein [Candidatus Peribacteria bacterium]
MYLDYAGFDTYDSIYRAKDIFLRDEFVIFTQDFHLKRAMYIAKRL